VIRIRAYRREDARAAAALISETYARFNANEGTKRAVRRYVELYRPDGRKSDEIHARFARTPIFYVAVHQTRIVGLVRGTPDRLINLFVAGSHHRRGIATRLVQKYEAACLRAGSRELRARASLFAIGFYESIGYRKTTGVRDFHGLSVQPMRKRLRSRNPESGAASSRRPARGRSYA
jgi:GNAT superfamily N-acetyltransferase